MVILPALDTLVTTTPSVPALRIFIDQHGFDMKQIISSALVSAAFLTTAASLDAKTIDFSGALEIYNYGGPDQPFGGVPGFIDVSIELDEAAAPDSEEDAGVAQLANYLTAVQSFTYDVFDGAGASLGTWSASDVEIQMLDFILGDGVQFFSVNTDGPAPFNRMQLQFEGAAGLWDGLSLEELTQDKLRNMTTGVMEISLLVGEGSFGARFALDIDTITVTDVTGPRPSAVPLPAGLPLLVAGLGAFGVIRRHRSGATGAKEMQA